MSISNPINDRNLNRFFRFTYPQGVETENFSENRMNTLGVGPIVFATMVDFMSCTGLIFIPIGGFWGDV